MIKFLAESINNKLLDFSLSNISFFFFLLGYVSKGKGNNSKKQINGTISNLKASAQQRKPSTK